VDVLGTGIEAAIRAERPIGEGAAADPVPRLDQQEILSGRPQRRCRRQPGRASPDDDHGSAPRRRPQGRCRQNG
jgi:hypothetical protein